MKIVSIYLPTHKSSIPINHFHNMATSSTRNNKTFNLRNMQRKMGFDHLRHVIQQGIPIDLKHGWYTNRLI